jgi:hypothetical protein
MKIVGVVVALLCFSSHNVDDYYHAVYNNSYFCNMRGNLRDGIFLDIFFLPICGTLFVR